MTKENENENLISYKILRIWNTQQTKMYGKLAALYRDTKIPMELNSVNDLRTETMLSIGILPSIF